jgi:predicted short-subunit dehydrogenase-like oxidoreductase (DUF2520 family)
VFESVCIVGAGRIGQALLARLDGRVAARATGRELACSGADLVIVCVPDRAVTEVANAIPPGPWITHTSGAVSLSALAPHERRFALHPLQTVQLDLGPEQLDGAWGAVTGETDAARAAGFELAALLGLRPFLLPDDDRPAYHAAATMAATFLVTLHDAAGDLLSSAGVPQEALVPLMRRTIENGFAPTGPFVRGDHETVGLHLAVIRERRPQLEPLYRALADATERLAVR